MPRPKYYRRQSDLCLQLAMLQTDPQTKLLLVELAKELQAKADDPGSTGTFDVPRWLQERLRTAPRGGDPRAVGDRKEAGDHKEAETYRVTRPDPPRRRRGPESQQV